MAQLKCPYCDTIEPDVIRLAPHVHTMHSEMNLSTRLYGIKNARTVETVDVVGPELKAQTTPCVCGADLNLAIEGDDVYWGHDYPRQGCADPLPAASLPTRVERDEVGVKASLMHAQFETAAAEMAELRKSFDAVDDRLKELDARLTRPSVVRRATLDQVWHQLIEAHQFPAAAIVMRMLKGVVDD